MMGFTFIWLLSINFLIIFGIFLLCANLMSFNFYLNFKHCWKINFKHVKIIQSDGGCEFVNQSLKDYFTSKYIIHHISCPGIPTQNGLAELHHRHIVETGLTLMAHSLVPPKF